MHRRVLTGITVAALALLVVQPVSAASTFTQVELSATVNGTSVVATTVVSASTSTAASSYGVCVRDSAGKNLDFTKQSNVTITTTGTRYTSPSKVFATGTYSYFPCVFANGGWVEPGARKSFTVGAVTPPPTTTSAPPTTATTTPPPVTTLFDDEFNGPAGQLADSAKWGYEVGANIRNGELQYYTDARPENASLDGSGNLRITVRKELFGGAAYTSALLWTQNKFTFTTGCAEARINTPVGSGLWPAFWTLGVGSWPAHGEVDILEEINSDQSTTSNLHGGPSHWSNFKSYPATRSAWHVYKSCLSSTQVTWYLDGVLKHTFLKSQMPAGQTWPFGVTPQYLLLNVAMGGSFPGNPNGTAVLPSTMLVDYVRVTP